jgi:uncharacterized membrane protein
MWLLNFIPDSFFAFVAHALLIAGIIGLVACFFLRYIPIVGRYELIVKIISAILLAVGIYFQGGLAVEQKWQERVKELEIKIKIAEEKSKQENVKIVEKVVTKIKVQKEYVEVVKKEIEVNKNDINKDCTVNDKAIELYNKALEEAK